MPQASRASKNIVYKAMGKPKYAMKVGRSAYRKAGRKASKKS